VPRHRRHCPNISGTFIIENELKELASHRASVDMAPFKQFEIEMSSPVSSFNSLKHASAS